MPKNNPILWSIVCVSSLLCGSGAFTGCTTDEDPTPTPPSGDDDTVEGDDDVTAGDDDDETAGEDDDETAGDDDDETAGDDDITAGDDDDETAGDDDVTAGDDDTGHGDDDTTVGDDDTTGDDDASSGDDDSTDSNSGSYEVSGALTYEHIPYDLETNGLDYLKIVQRPIRAARIALLDAATDTIIDETAADDSGHYSFNYQGPAEVKLWIYSEIQDPPIVVEDNTSQDALYVLESLTIDAKSTTSLDVIAQSGWGGTSYSSERQSGPFTVLDTAYSAMRRFLDETTDPPTFPLSVLNWSINNQPRSGNKANGNITTSHWDGEELYLLGKENVDTDEFDSHVVAHEWGHYFESMLGRSDSIGGSHSGGDVLDPRVAFGEGWGNAISAIALYPDSVYTDSLSRQQADGFSFDLEANDIEVDDNPGWYSEGSVQAIIYDLYDGPNESHDNIALGLDPLYQIMVGPQTTTDAYTTIFSFITYLKQILPDQEATIDQLVTYHSTNSHLGMNTIQDEWGTDETHDGDVEDGLPIYLEVAGDETLTITFDGSDSYNKWSQNRYFRFVGNGGPLTVETNGTYDVDLYAHQQGANIATSATTSGEESITFNTDKNVIYVVNVQGYDDSGAAYSTVVNLYN